MRHLPLGLGRQGLPSTTPEREAVGLKADSRRGPLWEGSAPRATPTRRLTHQAEAFASLPDGRGPWCGFGLRFAATSSSSAFLGKHPPLPHGGQGTSPQQMNQQVWAPNLIPAAASKVTASPPLGRMPGPGGSHRGAWVPWWVKNLSRLPSTRRTDTSVAQEMS